MSDVTRERSRAGDVSPAGVFLVLSMLLAFIAVCFSVSDQAPRKELLRLTGSVDRIQEYRSRASGYRGGESNAHQIRIIVSSDGQSVHVQQDYRLLAAYGPGVMTLQTGDEVDALVQRDPLGRGFFWLWDMKHDGKTLLSYDDLSRSFKAVDDFKRPFVRGTGALSLGLFLLSVFFRIRRGMWFRPEPVVPGVSIDREPEEPRYLTPGMPQWNSDEKQ